MEVHIPIYASVSFIPLLRKWKLSSEFCLCWKPGSKATYAGILAVNVWGQNGLPNVSKQEKGVGMGEWWTRYLLPQGYVWYIMTVSLVLSSFHAVSLYCSILAQHPLKMSSNQNALWKIHLSIHELVCVSMLMNISELSCPAPCPFTKNEITAFYLSPFAGWDSTCGIKMPTLPRLPLILSISIFASRIRLVIFLSLSALHS